MKKSFLVVMLAIICSIQVNARPISSVEATSSNSTPCREFNQTRQDTVSLNIEAHPSDMAFCLEGDPPIVIIYAEENCESFCWYINNDVSWNNPIVINPQQNHYFVITYVSGEECGALSYTFHIKYKANTLPNSFTEYVWAPEGEPFNLEAVGEDSLTTYYGYDIHWLNGPSSNDYSPTVPGDYTATISHPCGTATRIYKARHNVGIYRATVDLETNLNKVTWQINEIQTEFISQVKVYRDGILVGTVPYTDGYFMDNIGSENAARNYYLVAITTEGIECPLPSYQLGTLHVDFSPNANDPNKINMAWTSPYIEEGAPLTVTYFQICKYDPATSEVTVVDQIGANNTIGSYNISLFDGGYATVAAVFSEGKDYEELSFSNMTEDILGLGENAEAAFRIYPNPANGRFTVEGIGIMHISNVLGQEIMAKAIDGKEIVALPKGVYFVQLNGVVWKIVVE